MDKVFVLYHDRKFSRELGECNAGHVDRKRIGIFYSYEMCLKVLERCKLQPGFRQHRNDFHIDEYLIDAIYSDEVKTVLETGHEEAYTTLFVISYIITYEDGHEKNQIMGVFSSQERADEAAQIMVNHSHLDNLGDFLYLFEEEPNQTAWQKGFVTKNGVDYWKPLIDEKTGNIKHNEGPGSEFESIKLWASRCFE